MIDVARAVEYAHDQGIVHRDLKPANILVDSHGTPRITDFGLAKRIEADAGLTVTGQVMGTPSYMPPEQARGDVEAVGKPADIYSLGAVLYSLVTGRPPFRAASMIETLDQVVKDDPVPPATLNKAVDIDLDTIILKTLRKLPSQRYESAAALAEDLTRYLENRPIKARRVSAIGHLTRWGEAKPQFGRHALWDRCGIDHRRRRLRLRRDCLSPNGHRRAESARRGVAKLVRRRNERCRRRLDRS